MPTALLQTVISTVGGPKAAAELAAVGKEAQAVGTKGSAGLTSFAGAAKAAYAAAGFAAVAFAAVSVKAASDQGEALNKMNVVFGESSDRVRIFAESADAIGLSEAAALGAAANFGNMAQAAGVAQGASADMSIKLVKLAADMASFNNVDPNVALEKLQSGLAGMARPLREFGVFISEARVKTEAYDDGIAKTGSALTDAQKIQARYNIIMKDSAKQQGDFARTVGVSVPNQLRVASAEFKNLEAEAGKAFLPIMMSVLGVAEDLAPALTLVAGAAGPLLGIFVGYKAISFLPTLIDLLAGSTAVATTALVAEAGAAATASTALVGFVGSAQIAAAAEEELAASAAAADAAVGAGGLSGAVAGLTPVLLPLAVALGGAAIASNYLHSENTKTASFLTGTVVPAMAAGKVSADTWAQAVKAAALMHINLNAQLAAYTSKQKAAGSAAAGAQGPIAGLTNSVSGLSTTVHTAAGNVAALLGWLEAVSHPWSASFTLHTGAGGGFIPSAEGFSGTVRRPTLFLAGEAGPEKVNISPIAMGGAARPFSGASRTAGPAVVVNIGTVYGADSDVLAAELAPKISRQIQRRAAVLRT